jgi:ParB family chromosome partitioning protein
MSDHTDEVTTSSSADLPVAGDAAAPDECERPWCGAGPLSANLTTRPTMPVQWLTAHPGNVRADLDLSDEFVTSISENGVLVPLRITIDGEGDAENYRVIDGHRRLAAAVKAGLDEVPYDMASERCGDEAGQFLDMFNAHRHRKGFTRLEEADALFSASSAGATRTRIRRSTGLKPGQVKAALAAATLADDTRASVEELSRDRGDELTLEDLAIVAEFQDDPDALRRLMGLAIYHDSLEHEAERLRQERAERAAHDKLRAELEAVGLTITDTLPPGALRLTFLTHEGEQLTPESHVTCPGHAAYFQDWDLENPVYYCADPTAYEHQRPESAVSASPSPVLGAAGPSGSPPSASDPASPSVEDPEIAASRRRVIEGNRAWRAAAEVRHRWLASQLFGRRSAPREVDVFVATQLLTMPEVPRRYLSSALMSPAFDATTGQQVSQMIETCTTAASRKLPLLILAPLVAAYEHALSGLAGSQDTWRDNRFSPCPYADAGTYFTFLASIGYQLSSIEQAVATSTAWQPGTALTQVFADQATKQDSAADGDTVEDVLQDLSTDAADGQDVPATSDADISEEQAAA